MKYLPALCLAIVALMGAGCTGDADDRAFFGTGWMKPEAGANKRLANPQTVTPVRDDYDTSPMKEGAQKTQ